MNDNLHYIEFRRLLMQAVQYYAEYMRFIPFDGAFPIADGVVIEAHVSQRHAVDDTQPMRAAVRDEDAVHTCGTCGAELQIVRPGKWQCPNCE